MDTAAPHMVDTAALRYLLRAGGAVAGYAPPLLCFLHGYDEGAPLDIVAALTQYGPLRANNPATAIEHFVIVAPQLPIRGDLWLRYAPVVRQMILEAAQRHGCDGLRVYLTGFSFGANGVFELALAQPNLWAALWPVDPTRVPPQPIALPLWLSLGEISRSQTRGFIRRLALEPVESTPPSDRVWHDDGEDHVGTAIRAYSDARIYEWLLGKRRR